MSDTGSWINLTSFELDVSKKYILMSDNLQNISYPSKTRTLPIWPQDTATQHTEVSDGAWSKNRYWVNLWTLFLLNITSLAWGIGLTLWSRTGTERSIAHSQTQNDTNSWTMVCSHEQTKPNIYLHVSHSRYSVWTTHWKHQDFRLIVASLSRSISVSVSKSS